MRSGDGARGGHRKKFPAASCIKCPQEIPPARIVAPCCEVPFPHLPLTNSRDMGGFFVDRKWIPQSVGETLCASLRLSFSTDRRRCYPLEIIVNWPRCDDEGGYVCLPVVPRSRSPFSVPLSARRACLLVWREFWRLVSLGRVPILFGLLLRSSFMLDGLPLNSDRRFEVFFACDPAMVRFCGRRPRGE